MALGFDYTLSPDEQSSWKSFEEFAKKVSDKGINVPLTFGDGSGGSGSGNQPKLALEKQIKEIQNSLNKALDNLIIKSTNLDINDIIPINEIRAEIDKLGAMEAPLTDIRHESKLITQEIQEWITATRNYSKDLDNIGNITESLREKFKTIGDAKFEGVFDKINEEAVSMLQQQETTAKKVKLIQEGLFNNLNKLTLKVDNNMLDGILPVEPLKQGIEALGKAGESFESVKLREKELRLEMQQYGIVINNVNNIMEDMIANNGKLSNTLNLQGNMVDKLEQSYDKLKAVKDKADNAQKEIAEKQQLIRASKEYQDATEREKARIEELMSSMKIMAFSVESVDDQMKAYLQTLDKEKTLLDAKYLDEARRKYDDLEGTIKNLVVRYVSLQAILHNVKAYYQDVIQYTKDLDDAYTDVAISMDITREEFNTWTKDARVIAQANGQTTTSLMEMVKIYAQAGEDISDVQDKLAGTAMIQNITQWDAEQATSAVNSIINQYKLMDREINGITGDTANAIQYIGDNLIGISNALSIDNVKGIQEMVSAVDDAGSVIYNAGGSLEWFMGVTGALAEATNSTGSEIGATMRMVTARTLRQGDAISELEAQGEDLEIAMAKAERALEGIGVSIRGETADSLRDIEDIIGDVANAWDTLSDSERQAVSEAMAGTQRSSMFSALIENYDQVLKLQKEGLNSFGELAEANQKRVESFEGQLNILKDKMLAFTDGLQPLIFGSVELGNNLLDLVNDFGAIPTVVGLASASFLSFSDSGQKVKNTLMEMVGSKIQLVDGLNQVISAKTQLVESSKNEVAITQQQISSTIKRIAQLRLEHSAENDKTKDIYKEQQALVGLNKELINNQKQLAIATLKATAFQAALSLGLSVAISGVVWGLSKLWDSLKDGGINLDSVNSKFQELNNSQIELSKTVSSLDNMVAQYEDLEQQMKNSGKGSEEYKQAEESLLEIQKQIAENYPTLVSYIDEEGNAYATNLDSIKTYTEAQRELLETQKEALESTAKTNKPKLEVELGELETDRDKIKEKIDYYTQQIEDLETKMANSGNAIFKTLAKGDIAMFTSEKNRLIEKLTETNEKISETSKTLVGYEQILQETSEKTEKAVDSTNELANSMRELEDVTPMKDLNESYLKAVEGIAEAQELLDSFKDGLTSSELRSIFDSELMKDYNGALTDTVSIQEYLNEKIKEMENTSNEAYNNMLKQDENYWNTKMKNSETWANYEQESQNEMVRIAAEALGVKEADFQNYINEKGGMRDVDLSNAKNMADAERILNGDLNSQVLGFFSKFINEKADARIDDMDNVVAFLKAQNTEEVKTIQQLAQLWNDYYNAKRAEISNALTATKNVTMTLNKAQQQIKDDGIKKLEEAGLKMPGVKDHYSSLYDQSIKTVQGNKTQVEELNKQLQQLEKENNTFTSLMNGLKGYNASNSLKQDYVDADKGNFVGSSSNVSNSNKGSSSSNKGSSSSSKDTEKEVANLELEIDRYYKLNDAIRDLGNSLSMLQAKREQITTKDAYKKSIEEEIALVNKQITAQQNLLKEQQKERNEIKSTLSKNGFKFDSSNNISNYAAQLKKLQDAANKKSGEAKEAAIAQVEALADLIDKYNELNDDTIPSTSVEIQNLKNEITSLNKELEENMKAIEKMGDRYFYITSKIAKVDNALSMNQALQETANDERKIELMKEQIDLIKQRQDLVKQEQNEAKQEQTELKAQLAQKGVTFNSSGQVANYEGLIRSLESKANNLVGDAQSEAVEEIEELLDLIEKYTTLTDDTIPGLELSWQEYVNEMQSVQDAIDDIYQQQKENAVQTQKDIASAYEKYLTERYNKLKDALNKEQEAYNKAYDEENFQRDLSKQQRALDEIAQQIAIYERDTSAVGQARLEQLRKEYEEQQQAINDMIREQEKSKTDEAFAEASESLDEELENALSPENVANIVNQALATGFVTIGDSVVELNGLMTQWLDETGDGLYLLGDTIKSEMIDNLQQAKELINELDSTSSWSKMIGLASVNSNNLGKAVPQSISFAFNQPLVNVEGNADSDVLDTISGQITSQINSMEQRIYQEIKNVLT